jgi:hypothetical protein
MDSLEYRFWDVDPRGSFGYDRKQSTAHRANEDDKDRGNSKVGVGVGPSARSTVNAGHCWLNRDQGISTRNDTRNSSVVGSF